MTECITVETEIFEYREVKPHFINPCCFGEDFAAWLKQELAPLLGPGFVLSEIIQEDYGWGFWARCGKDPFWVAVGWVGDAPEACSGQWMVVTSYDPGLNVIKRLFHTPDAKSFAKLLEGVLRALRSNSDIKMIEPN